MSLTLTITSPIPTLPPEALERALRVVEQQTKQTNELGHIQVSLVDEAVARHLNRQHAGNDYATDVLSFDYFEAEGGQTARANDIRGEIVMCLPVAEQQAATHGTSLADELLLLFVHGLLHILGYDHDAAAQASFERLQNAIMGKLTDAKREFFL